MLSGGRFVPGIAVGSREDDYGASGASFHNRGRRLEEQIAEMRRIWAGESQGLDGAIGPAPATLPRLSSAVIPRRSSSAWRAWRTAGSWVPPERRKD